MFAAATASAIITNALTMGMSMNRSLFASPLGRSTVGVLGPGSAAKSLALRDKSPSPRAPTDTTLAPSTWGGGRGGRVRGLGGGGGGARGGGVGGRGAACRVRGCGRSSLTVAGRMVAQVPGTARQGHAVDRRGGPGGGSSGWRRYAVVDRTCFRDRSGLAWLVDGVGLRWAVLGAARRTAVALGLGEFEFESCLPG